MRTLSADDMAGYGEATIEAVAPFVSERPDIVVHGCTAGGFLAGPEGNARIVAQLERATGAPVMSTADAMVEALRHGGVRSTTVVTPYLPSVNEGLTRYVEAGGVEVDTLSSFLCETTDALGAVTEPQVLEKALATVTPQQPGAVHRLLAAADARHHPSVAGAPWHSGLVVDPGHRLGRVAPARRQGPASCRFDAESASAPCGRSAAPAQA